jgi:hypothetical protein
VWWHTPVTLALRRPKQEDPRFEASLGFITRLCLKKTIKSGINWGQCQAGKIEVCNHYTGKWYRLESSWDSGEYRIRRGLNYFTKSQQFLHSFKKLRGGGRGEK